MNSRHNEIEPIRWWQVVLGGIAFAGAVLVLIWGFAILGFMLEGEL